MYVNGEFSVIYRCEVFLDPLHYESGFYWCWGQVCFLLVCLSIDKRSHKRIILITWKPSSYYFCCKKVYVLFTFRIYNVINKWLNYETFLYFVRTIIVLFGLLGFRRTKKWMGEVVINSWNFRFFSILKILTVNFEFKQNLSWIYSWCMLNWYGTPAYCYTLPLEIN